MNLIDSHDVNRALFVMTEQGDNGLTQAKQRLKLAALFQFTYIGAPTVWYGDEVALNSPSKYSSPNGPVGDPYTRAPYPWRDQPGDPNIYGPPDMNMFGYYAKLGHLRKLYRALRQGNFVTLLVGDTQQSNSAPNTYAFVRTMVGEIPVVVALNNGTASNQASIPVNGIFPDGTHLRDALSGGHYSVTAGAIQVSLAARTGVLLVPNGMRDNFAAPAASIRLGSSANSSGWSNTPVNLDLSASDSGVGIAELRYWADEGVVSAVQGESASLTLANEGVYSVGLRAIDNAGYVSQPATQVVQIDLHPPVVIVTGVRQGASYPMGRVPAAGCSTADALSGVATKATLTVRGGNGHFTATCSGATDNAGNAAQPVSVTYSVLRSGSR
jgi:hypothetical protein